MIGYDEILDAVHDYLVGATAAPAAKIRRADDSGTRPSPPYLTVKVLTAGHVAASDEAVVDDGGIKARHTSIEHATVSVQGYGTDTFLWLTQAKNRMGLDRYLRVAMDQGVTLRSPGVIEDLTAFVDTQHERRWLLEFEAAYAVVLDEEEPDGEHLAAQTADVGHTLEGDAGDLVDTTTHDLTGAP